MSNITAQKNKNTGVVHCESLVVDQRILVGGDITAKSPGTRVVIDADATVNGNLLVNGTVALGLEHASRPLTAGDVSLAYPYDYIIVGGGTAGSALTYKLNQLRPNLKLLVIESGQDDQVLADTVPGLAVAGSVQEVYPANGNVWSRYINGGFFTVVNADTNALHVWNYAIQTKKDAAVSIGVPEFTYNFGSTWGGSTAHNYQVWLRPTKWYFEYLQSLGLTEFTYEESVTYFKEIENRSALGPKVDGNIGAPYPPFYNAANTNPYEPNPLLADNGFDPALQGNSGRIVLFQQNYIDPAFQTLLSTFQQINTELGSTRFGLLVSSEQEQYRELINRQSFTGIVNVVATASQPVIYDNIGGIIRKSLLPQSPADYTTANTFTRVHAGVAYLLPVSQMPNVTVLSNKFVTKVTMNSQNRVTGVQYISGRNVYRSGRNNQPDFADSLLPASGGPGQPATTLGAVSGTQAAYNNSVVALQNVTTVQCNYEVVLCAGFVHTPKILELSGIGNSAVLGKVGIQTLVHSPGVGENLSDHNVIGPAFSGAVPNYGLYIAGGLLPAGLNLCNYRYKSGATSDDRPDVVGIVVLRNTARNIYPTLFDNANNITRFYAPNPFLVKDGYRPRDNIAQPSLPGMNFTQQLCYPESRGSTHIRTSTPTDVPTTCVNPYESTVDIQRAINAFIFSCEMAERARGTSYVEAAVAAPFSNIPTTDPKRKLFQDYQVPTYAEFTDSFYQFTGALVSQVDPLNFNLGTFALGNPGLQKQLNQNYLEFTSGSAIGQKRMILSWNPTTRIARIAAPFDLTAVITNASGTGVTVTYTAANSFIVGQTVTITGVNPVAYNIVGVIATASATNFTITDPAVGVYVSGGLATLPAIAPGDAIGIRRINPGKVATFCKDSFFTTWHGCGTAKMGLAYDSSAVVDQNHRVFGVVGLRVADNSIYPVVTDCNTQSSAYLAGWRCAYKINSDLNLL